MTFAVVPAAGKSARMGRPKLALPLGGRTVLECVVETLRRAGVEPVVVVVGPDGSELASLAVAAGAHAVQLDADTADMRATVERGLDWVEERVHPRPEDDWLLVPADHPALDTEVIRTLLRARASHPGAGVIVPVHGGQRGHPALIAWKHVAHMRLLPPGKGLNVYLRRQAAEPLEVPVESPGVLLDLDTPEDYDRLLAKGL